ncbi:MAG: transcription antitermination factor NusB [Phycisphaeraceae bacterium]
MPKRRDIRRLAMQVLYQLDLGSKPERDALLADLDEYDPPEVRAAATDLALAAWPDREVADSYSRQLAPDWPPHRQPAVDRAILRLAHYEMTSGHAPTKVVINEAVELAKRFSGEHSPAFINGVLDKLARQLREEGRLHEPEPAERPASEQDWLRDAVEEE